MTEERLTSEVLEGFRAAQRVAYDAVTEVASGLTAGVTEREAAARIGQALARRGVRDFFHRPFAWFGDRARFAGFRTPLDFFPSDRRLQVGMAAILDVGPVLNGYCADIGYTFCLGHSTEVRTAQEALRDFRSHILAAVRAERPLRQLYREVDEMIADLGYENCHQRYPFGVLGHRIQMQPLPRVRLPMLLGFGAGVGVRLLQQAARARVLKSDSPFWNAELPPEARATEGLWAIEPHIGRGEVGAKWEEMLLVTESDVRWLDDDVPHVHAWAQHSADQPQQRGAS